MVKKSFKNNINPAMQFISTVEEPEVVEQPVVEKKTSEVIPEGYKVDYRFVETKSRRLSLLVQPSIHDKLKKGAAASGKSLNEYIHSLLEEAVKGE